MISNLNILYGKDVRLVISRLPTVSYFISRVSIPSVNSSPAKFNTPFATINVHGDKLEYSPLNITFKVDEDLRNYEELLSWLQSYAPSESFEAYKNSAGTTNPSDKQAYRAQYEQSTALLSTNKDNPNVGFIFTDVFPTDLGELEIDLTSTDVPTLTCSATFSYTSFKISR